MRYAEDEKHSQIEINRQRKKTTALKNLAVDIHRLRARVRRDLDGENEKTRLTALIVAVMDKTGERVGNEASAENGHVGVTGLKKEHVGIDKEIVTLKYIGKSGVDQSKQFTDSKIASALADVLEGKTASDYVFQTEDGFKIKADRVNRYLRDFSVTAKDIRGFAANRFMLESLRKAVKSDDEKERKHKFMDILESVASRVGHTKFTLRKHYLLPKIEEEYVKHGQIINLRDASNAIHINSMRFATIAMRVMVGFMLSEKKKL